MRQNIKSVLIRFVIPFFTLLALLAIVCLILFYQLGFKGKLDFKSSGPNPNSLPTGQNIQIGLKAREVDYGEITSVVLDPFEEGIVNHLNIPLVLTTLDYIYIPSGYLAREEQLCIQKLDIESQGLGSSAQKLIDPALSGGKDLCFGSGQNIIIGEPTAKLIYNRYSRDYIDLYQYPFDSRSLNFNISIDAYAIDKSNDQKLFVKLKDVEIRVASTEKEVWLLNTQNVDDTPDEIALKMTMMRHPKEKKLALAVLASLLMVLIGLPLFTSTDSFWDAVGVLIGLWGVQDIIIPDYIHSNTIVRDFIGRIYLLIPVMIVFKILKGYWENKLLVYAKRTVQTRNVSENIDSHKLAMQILSGKKSDEQIQIWAEQELAARIPINENIDELIKWARDEIKSGIPQNSVTWAFSYRARDVNLTKEQVQSLMAVLVRLTSKKD